MYNLIVLLYMLMYCWVFVLHVFFINLCYLLYSAATLKHVFLGGTSFIRLVIGALGSRPSQVHLTIINHHIA